MLRSKDWCNCVHVQVLTEAIELALDDIRSGDSDAARLELESVMKVHDDAGRRYAIEILGERK